MTKPKILMIETDLATIDLYRGILKKDYEVISHSDEPRLLDLISTHTLHAIILEPAMNGGLGWKIFEVLRTETPERPVPIIVCTTSDERKRGLEMGAAAYLIKPVLPTLLLQTLSKLPNADSLV